MANRFLSNIRINDAYTFPASDGTNNQVIKTDGSGNLSFGQLAADSASVMYKDTFTGDGSTTGFSLANALNDEVQSNIYIDGVYQSKSTYSVSGTTVTFSTAPASGHEIEVISTTGINSGPTAIYTDTFTANGSATAFTLGQTVHDENQTIVFLNGVYQFKGTYTLSGTTLTLDTAPANGVAIEVMSIGSAYSGGDILYDHDFASAGLMTTNGSGVYSITANNSANWNTAYGWGDHSTQSYATQSYVGTQIANLVDSSPSTLNTLNELAAALGDDPNFATTTANSIGTKLPLAGGTLTGGLTGTTAGFSGSITASGNSNSFGNTTIAALSASTGTFSASVTAAGNSNSFGATTFTGTVTTENIFQVYSTGVSLVIGAIGNTANDLNIYSTTNGHNGLRMHANGILPTDNTGTIIDNDADLGDPSYRFKNLYLGGSITSGTGIIKPSIGGDIAITQGAIGLRINDAASAISPTTATANNDNTVDLGVSNIRFRNLYMGGNITFGDSHFIGDDADNNLLIQSSANENIIINSVDDLLLRTGGTTKLIVKNNGDVGIGTTSPSGKLNVEAPGNHLHLRAGTAAAGKYWNFDVTANNQLYIITDGNNGINITNTGDVGIGTVTNTARLNVGGKLKITDDLIMAQTNGRIDYDNGVSSGALRFFSTSGNTERMRITSAGSVGIGTTSPNDKLEVSGGNIRIYSTNNANHLIIKNNATGTSGTFEERIKFLGWNNNENAAIIGMGNAYFGSPVNALAFQVSAVEAMRIKHGGNVGIGTAQGPGDVNAKLHVYNQAGDNTVTELLRLDCGENNHNVGKGGAIVFRDINVYSDTAKIIAQRVGNSGGSTLQFALRGGEKMRITSGGEIQVGNAVGGSDVDTGTRINTTQMRQSSSGTGAHDFHDFYRGTEGSLVRVGNIRTTGTTTAYNTSSDYRLKENVVKMTGALDRVSQLKPSRFNFIVDADTTVDGFLAHEVQEIVPEAITGQKNEVDEDGNPEYQGIDQSKLVPLLVGAIQELKAHNDSLKARIETLENN